MDAYLAALGFALLPAAGNFAGGLVAEAVAVSRRVLRYALHLAAGIVLAVVGLELMPEGFAVTATFKEKKVPRRQRVLISAAFALPILLGATLGFWAVRGQPEIVKFSLLAFTGGVLTTVVVEEIVPEAHQGEETRLAALALVGGFALFALLSVYFGA